MRIGLDIGTTFCKAVVFDKEYNQVDIRSKSYPTYTNHDGYSTQNPSLLLDAVDEVLEPLLANYTIKSISLSTAMHSLILMGENRNYLSDIILWSDTRAASLVEGKSYQEFYLKTGLPIHPMSPFSKLLWFREHDEKRLREVYRYYDIKSLVYEHLTGEYCIDYSLASGTGLFNIHELNWDLEILDYLQIDSEKLPKLVDVDYKQPNKDGVLIHIGASDGCLSNVGLGAVNPGDFAINLGTSAAIRTVSDKIYIDPEANNFCYYLSKGKWVVGHASSNAGNVFNWLQSQYEGLRYEDIVRIAESVDSQGLYFIPYLNGERSTDWDGSYKASYVGITASHGPEAMIKAALEGIFYNIRKLYDAMPLENTGSLRVGGGLLNAPSLQKLFSYIIGRSVEVIDYDEAACLGAVLLFEGDSLQIKSRIVDSISYIPQKYYEEYLLIDLHYRHLMALLRENK